MIKKGTFFQLFVDICAFFLSWALTNKILSVIVGIMALTNKQKRFIRDKVKALGSKSAVYEFYNRKSIVCEYAYKIAEKLYKKV